MKIKKKKKRILLVKKKKAVLMEDEGKLISSGRLKLNHLINFLREKRRVEGNRNEMGLIREHYEKLFDVFPPWDVQPLVLLYTKIEYAYLKKDFEECGLPLPVKVDQNYQASKKFNLKGFTRDLQNMLRISVNSETEGDAKMAKKTKGKKKQQVSSKEKKGRIVGVAEFVFNLLADNVRKKLKDKDLAEKVTKAFPDRAKRDEDYIKRHRSIFNSGKFPQQGGKKPKDKLEEFGKAKTKEVKSKKEEPKKEKKVKKVKAKLTKKVKPEVVPEPKKKKKFILKKKKG